MDENNHPNETEPSISTNDSAWTPGPPEQDSAGQQTAKSAFSMGPSPEQKTDTSQNQENFTPSSYNYSDMVSSIPDEPSNSLAIASFILAILSIPSSCCCGFGLLPSILGIIFGCLQPADSYGKKPGMAIAGIIISVVGLLISFFFAGFSLLRYLS